MANTLTATLRTSRGPVVVRLFPDHAPKTVRNFIELAEGSREWTNPVTRQKAQAKLSDLRDSDTAKKAQEKLRDLADSDTAHKAQEKLHDLLSSDTAKKAQDKLRELRTTVTEGAKSDDGS